MHTYDFIIVSPTGSTIYASDTFETSAEALEASREWWANLSESDYNNLENYRTKIERLT